VGASKEAFRRGPRKIKDGMRSLGIGHQQMPLARLWRKRPVDGTADDGGFNHALVQGASSSRK